MIYHRWQFWVSIAVLLGAAIYCRVPPAGEAVPLRKPLRDFPLHINDWLGKDQGLSSKIVEKLGVEDSLMRDYQNGKGGYLSLYIGFYERQGHGDTIHSPKHCYPGGGWQPVDNRSQEIVLTSGQTITVNRYLIQKGIEKQLVLYWYHERGRVISNEYWAKFYLIFDAITKNRTDGALVRISAPVTVSVDETFVYEEQFTKLTFPLLREFLPE